MKVYKQLYYWDIIENIQSGKSVYLFDKEEKQFYCVNDVSVEEYAKNMDLYQKNTNRFTIWIEEETEVKE